MVTDCDNSLGTLTHVARHMASIGMQHQFGSAMSLESNYVWTGGRKEEFAPNINLSYDPADPVGAGDTPQAERQAEAILNSAARDEQEVQGRKQRVNQPDTPPRGKDW